MSVLDEIAIAHAKHVHERFERVRLGMQLITEQSDELRRLLLEYGNHKEDCLLMGAIPQGPCGCGWDDAHAQIEGKPDGSDASD